MSYPNIDFTLANFCV